MDKKIRKTILFLGIIFCLFLAVFACRPAGRVFAKLEVTYPQIFGLQINDSSSFSDYVCYVVGLGINLAVFIAVIVIAFGGVYYLLDYGRGKFTSGAKDWIKAGILGLLIVICSSLIAYTINPDLTNCRPAILSLINLPNPGNPATRSNATIASYKEIPIGTLTETLLTRTMDCYGFDQSGNPVDGDLNADDGKSGTPTYSDHDRADCLAQLIDGAQKKSQIVATLSDEITKLMNKCDCQGKCENDCGGQCDQPKKCPNDPGYKCTGRCVKYPCKSPPYSSTTPPPPDCCPADSGVADPNNPRKNLSVKDLIEHGPISVSIDVGASIGAAVSSTSTPTAASRGASCKTQAISYKGLDELRSNYNNNYGSIKASIEKTVYINGKQTTIIDTGNCGTCPATLSAINLIICQNKVDTCKKNSKWGKLKLIDQLTYFKGKINDWADDSKIKDDKKALDKARSDLGKCYLAIPYIDLLKTYEITSQENHIILTQKFSNPVTNDPVDASKYCTGFNYNNSSCFKKCNDTCPDTGNLQCYQQNCKPCIDTCPTCGFLNSVGTGAGVGTVVGSIPGGVIGGVAGAGAYASCMLQRSQCEDKVTACRKTQETCVEACYNSRPCPNASNNPPKTFGQNINPTPCIPNPPCPGQCKKNPQGTYTCGGINSITQVPCLPDCPSGQTCDSGTNLCVSSSPLSAPQDCMSSCQNDCSDNCAKKYLPCSNEYNFCQSQCKNNGQCVLNNAGSCLFGAANFQQCGQIASQNADQGNINYCINNAYSCKNGSDEYAGYQDCTQSARPSSLVSGIQNTMQTLFPLMPISYWGNLITDPQNVCSQGYSSSFLFNHPECEKCLEPYKSPDIGSSCYSAANAVAGSSSCQQLCPEVTKCPTSSNCPYCPCDQINQTLSFSVPNESVSDKKDPKYNAGNEGYTVSGQKISDDEMVGPQCNGYSYNDDPLTFYCEDSWWADPSKEGTSPTPMGTERICPASGEVPVGQTVDDAENWADGLIKKADNMNKDIQNIFDVAVKIGNANKPTNIIRDYCKCAAKMDDGNPICETDCKYKETKVPAAPASVDADGNAIPAVPEHYICTCTFMPCNGNPCQQITDYISQLWNSYRQLKLDYIDFYTTMLAEPRSDIMKELAYSRKTTNACSLVNTAYGASARLLDCTRVEDEIISPVKTGQMIFTGRTFKGYCYGTQLGRVSTPPSSLTDNWFCCQEYSQNPTPNANPIYNIQK